MLWTGPFIANDWTFFNESVGMPFGILELAFNDAGEVVINIANNLNSQLHKTGIIGAEPQSTTAA